MSLRVFDFQCPVGHRNEMFTEADVRSVQCPTCGKLAQRLIANPRAVLEGITGSFPGAAMTWEKRRESHMKKETRNQERHGTYD